MKIERDGQTLAISETPGWLWIFGCFFIVIGAAFVYGASGGYSNYDEATRFEIAAHFIGGLTAVAVGFGVIWYAPLTRLTIDRNTETVTLKRRGISGRANRVFRFEEVKQFFILEDVDSDGDPVWSLGMELADSEIVEISVFKTPDEKFKRDVAFQANELMYKQLPSYRDAFVPEDESSTLML